MMSLGEYRNRAALLSDYLPWAALVEKGVVLNKDGSFQRTARIRGPDLDSATPAELVGVTGRLNNALRRLGSGWAVFVEAQRVPATIDRGAHCSMLEIDVEVPGLSDKDKADNKAKTAASGKPPAGGKTKPA